MRHPVYSVALVSLAFAAGHRASAQPANDECANAETFFGFPTAVSNIGATTDGFATCTPSGSDVWYRFVEGNYYIRHLFSTTCAGFDTVLSAYDGCGGPQLACNDDGCGIAGGSGVFVSTYPGQEILIRVAGYGSINPAQGTTTLSTDVQRFLGDTCSDAIGIGAGIVYPFDTTNYQSEDSPSGTSCLGNSSKSMYFKFRGSGTGKANISLCGSAFDTTLALYNGCDSSAANMGCNDDAPACGLQSELVSPRIYFGQEYFVRVSGYQFNEGVGQILVTETPTCSETEYEGRFIQPWGPVAYEDISASGTPLALTDDSALPVAIGFPFTYFGNTYSDVSVCSNGFLQFGGNSTAYINAPGLDPTEPNNIIAPHWDDYVPGLEGGAVHTVLRGESPYRQLIVSWKNVREYFTPVTNMSSFQVVLNENGSFMFRYGALAPRADPTDVSVGFEDETGTLGSIANATANAQTLPSVVYSPPCPPTNDTIDFNGDGVAPDTLDIEDFISVFGGGPCSNDPNCGDIDFNNDGVSPDFADLELLLCVYGGGSC